MIKLYDSLKKLYPEKKIPKGIFSLEEVGILTIYDLLWALPNHIEQIPELAPISNATMDELFLGKGRIHEVKSRPNFYRRGMRGALLKNIEVIFNDSLSNDQISLKWFNTYSNKEKSLKAISKEEVIYILGTPSIYKSKIQIVNPSIHSEEELLNLRKKITYPTINKVKGSFIQKIFEKIPKTIWNEIEDFIPEDIIKKRNMLPLDESFKLLHGPKGEENIEMNLPLALKRLIYEEFIQNQIRAILRKEIRNKSIKRPLILDKKYYSELLTNLPYSLTKDQVICINDIIEEFSIGLPIARLVQGDVGCGKTTIAIVLSALLAKSGYQTALMCPTETLATQHLKEFQTLLKKEKLNIEIILGVTPKKEKEKIKERIKEGEIDIIIGTHALIQDDVTFKNLGLSIIDEQHKFGVEQRTKLQEKTYQGNFMVMTATPIPRSLRLTQYGDLEVSLIKTFPIGKKETKTRIINNETFGKFLQFLRTRISLGEQAYIVVPTIESEKMEHLHSTELVCKKFRKYFPDLNIQIIHGQLDSHIKKNLMEEFSLNRINILISTTVIEVGINVPNATIMAILNPERFGLSTLHQLRGRVGRNGNPGFCFLILENQSDQVSQKRLETFEKCNDGFILSEEDLKIRGEGNLFGRDQSGISSENRLANIIEHKEILDEAIEDAHEIMNRLGSTKKKAFQKKALESYFLTTV